VIASIAFGTNIFISSMQVFAPLVEFGLSHFIENSDVTVINYVSSNLLFSTVPLNVVIRHHLYPIFPIPSVNTLLRTIHTVQSLTYFSMKILGEGRYVCTIINILFMHYWIYCTWKVFMYNKFNNAWKVC